MKRLRRRSRAPVLSRNVRDAEILGTLHERPDLRADQPHPAQQIPRSAGTCPVNYRRSHDGDSPILLG